MGLLGILDYVVLVTVVGGSLGIGLIFARKKQTSQEYTSGAGKLGVLPVGMSLTVSYISAITIQGTPAEVYLYGPEFMLTLLSYWGCLIGAVTFVPLYLRLDIESVFQYLEMRFEHKLPRLAGVFFGILAPVFYMGIATLGPSYALESVTGVSTSIYIVAMMTICTLYTSLGGIKAVIWTDVFQSIVMLLGLLTIIVLGIMKLDDNTSLWAELQKRSRLDFHLSADPTLRVNSWILVFAHGVNWFTYLSLPSSLIRYRAVGTVRRAEQVVAIGSLGFFLIGLLACLAGLVVYAYYSSIDCGPMGSGVVHSPNQIVAYFVADVISLPGFTGLFIASLIAASFSSISSAQSAISSVLWYDILEPRMPGISDFKKTFIMKISAIVFGIMGTVLAFLFKTLGGSLVQISATVMSAVASPSLAMFLVGATVPFVGWQSISVSALLSFLLLSFIAVGSKLYGTDWERPILINEGCSLGNATDSNEFNSTALFHEIQPVDKYEEDFLVELFSISPFLYPVIGVLATYIISLILSIFPVLRQKTISAGMLFPFMDKCSTSTEKSTKSEVFDNVSENKEIQLLKISSL